MKHLNQFITEYIVKKKLDKFVDSEHNYEYFPKTKEELIENIKELISKRKYNFNCIDTSDITDMSQLFDTLKIRKKIDISNWNVRNVKDMTDMFNGFTYFNCDLSKWNVSNVTNMDNMFDGCKKFNCDLSDWDISNISRWKNMFGGCDKMTIPSWYKLYYRK